VVRDLFQWIGIERLSIYGACKRLETRVFCRHAAARPGIAPTVWSMLKNPAYKGKAAFGKTRLGPMRPRLRGGARMSGPAAWRTKLLCDARRTRDRHRGLPAIVGEDLFDAVGEQTEGKPETLPQRHTRRVICFRA